MANRQFQKTKETATNHREQAFLNLMILQTHLFMKNFNVIASQVDTILELLGELKEKEQSKTVQAQYNIYFSKINVIGALAYVVDCETAEEKLSKILIIFTSFLEPNTLDLKERVQQSTQVFTKRELRLLHSTQSRISSS